IDVSSFSTAELSAILRDKFLKFSKCLSCVDYKTMSRSPVFECYCDLAVQLQRVKLLSLTREEKLAFFINTYNALVILRLGFFIYVSCLIGGEVFTLQDIENRVLRGNRNGVARLLRPFSKTEPRLQVALPDTEPLIHLALNCETPQVTHWGFTLQLRMAAEAFLEIDDVYVWYKADFGDTDEKLLKWILEHMGSLLSGPAFRVSSPGKIKVTYCTCPKTGAPTAFTKAEQQVIETHSNTEKHKVKPADTSILSKEVCVSSPNPFFLFLPLCTSTLCEPTVHSESIQTP
uniref:DUF547 domain-containing protein n=1 Tax=Oncorhynchus tshawytscha TaxID=74940 RepID=A0A8C8D3S7_ONCTS